MSNGNNLEYKNTRNGRPRSGPDGRVLIGLIIRINTPIISAVQSTDVLDNIINAIVCQSVTVRCIAIWPDLSQVNSRITSGPKGTLRVGTLRVWYALGGGSGFLNRQLTRPKLLLRRKVVA